MRFLCRTGIVPLLYCIAPSGAFAGVWFNACEQYFTVHFNRCWLSLLFNGPLSVSCPALANMMVTALLLPIYVIWDNDDQLARHFDYATGLRYMAWQPVGMTYLSEEIHPSSLAFQSACISAASSLGMKRRTAVSSRTFNRRIALAAIDYFALASALMFMENPPESRFRPTCLRGRYLSTFVCTGVTGITVIVRRRLC